MYYRTNIHWYGFITILKKTVLRQDICVFTHHQTLLLQYHRNKCLACSWGLICTWYLRILHTFHGAWVLDLPYLCTKLIKKNTNQSEQLMLEWLCFRISSEITFKKPEIFCSSQNRWAERVTITLTSLQESSTCPLSLTLISYEQPSERVYMWIFQQIKILTLQPELR